MKSPSPRPLSIKLISLNFVCGGYLTTLVVSLSPQVAAHTAIFGFYIHGLLAAWYNLFFMGAASVFLGIGLWYMRDRARQLAIAYSAYFILNTILQALNPWTKQAFAQVLMQVYWNWAFAIAVNILMIWFLIRRRGAFARAEQHRLDQVRQRPAPWAIHAYKRRMILQLSFCALALLAIGIIVVTNKLEWITPLLMTGVVLVGFNLRCPTCTIYLGRKQATLNGSCNNCKASLWEPRKRPLQPVTSKA